MNRRTAVRSLMAAAVAGPELLRWPSGSSTLRWRAPARSGAAPSPANPLRLASNENPLGMPEAAVRAIEREMADGNRYPGELVARLAAAVAERHGLARENVVLGNGSTEVLRMVVQALAREGARVALPDPTFEHVERYAQPLTGEIVKVPLRSDWSHDLDAMRAAAAAPGPVLVFICNPNNPTGTLTSCDAVQRWIESAPERVFFLVDEAYFDFVENAGGNGYRSMLPLLDRPNVLISRTFSKIFGLAGLRVGYGLASADVIRRIRAFSGLSNINHFAAVAAYAAMGETAYMRRSLEVNREGRVILVRALDELGIEHLHSETNFVMHRVRAPLAEYNARMRERGVWVARPFPPLVEYSRVSIGLPDEMRAFVTVLREFRSLGLV